MNPKHTVSISEARKKIFQIADEVQKPDTYYTLTENGKPKAVILSYEDYDSLIETLDVMHEMPELDEEIKEYGQDLKTGKYKNYTTLEQLLAKDGYVLAEKAQREYGVSPQVQTKSGKRSRKASTKRSI